MVRSQQIRQARLNRALIAAVKRKEAPVVERLLKQGADANARDLPEQRISLWHLVS